MGFLDNQGLATLWECIVGKIEIALGTVKAFSNITTKSGSTVTTVEAPGLTSGLTIEAGDNITLVTNAATNTIKIIGADAPEAPEASLESLGISATPTEINHIAGATSNIQNQLNTKVPTSRTVNGKALSSNITLSASDVSARSNTWVPALTDCSGTLSVAKGGTGATDAATACANLGAVKKSGDTMTGTLYRQSTAGAIGLAIGTASKPENVSIISVGDGTEFNRFSFRQYGTNGNRENFNLPNTTTPAQNVNYDILTTKSPVTIAQGGTGATDAATACKNLGAATVLTGTEIPSNANLNNYTTPGTYRSPSGTVSATLSNAPYTTTGFKLEVFNTTSSSQIIQEIKCNAGSARTYRRQASSSNGVWTFNNWYKVMQSTNDALAIGDGGTGATTAADARVNLGAVASTNGSVDTTLSIQSASYPALYFKDSDDEKVKAAVLGTMSTNRVYIRSYATDTNYYENYYMPKASTGLTANVDTYFIWTNKQMKYSSSQPTNPTSGDIWFKPV